MRRQDIIDALERVELPVFEPVVQFQEEFGGCMLPEHQQFRYFDLLLYTPDRVLDPRSRLLERFGKEPVESAIHAQELNGTWFFECGEMSRSSPFFVELSQAGALCVGYSLDEPFEVAPSVEHWLETRALDSETRGTWQYLKGKSWLGPAPGEALARWLDGTFQPLPGAYHHFESWWEGDDLRIQLRWFWDPQRRTGGDLGAWMRPGGDVTRARTHLAAMLAVVPSPE
ncbi:hypothetical protein [Hyalangium rubrum]|uniref:SMI1/KNR4 family protein n=1 Tax=Hyalangium rubrum TaxID=3103134 RepID=A0ABU5HCJ5_9BACT|nr:hypothetical protein [Hyalangium sp. s54d21]MDY7230609.1 hypothetical protein [Hyalangium sp. s54d21]